MPIEWTFVEFRKAHSGKMRGQGMDQEFCQPWVIYDIFKELAPLHPTIIAVTQDLCSAMHKPGRW